MTLSTVSDVDRSVTATVTPTTRPTVNPHAAIGGLVVWLRDNGVSLAHADQSPEACRRRSALMRQLLTEFSLNPMSAGDRAAAHALAEAGVR